jgi:antitoxin YefM
MSTTVNFTDLRQNLKSYIDHVNDTHEHITITTKEKNNAVLISAEDWSAIEEALYLSASPANLKRINTARKSIGKKMTLDELDNFVSS